MRHRLCLVVSLHLPCVSTPFVANAPCKTPHLPCVSTALSPSTAGFPPVRTTPLPLLLPSLPDPSTIDSSPLSPHTSDFGTPLATTRVANVGHLAGCILAGCGRARFGQRVDAHRIHRPDLLEHRRRRLPAAGRSLAAMLLGAAAARVRCCCLPLLAAAAAAADPAASTPLPPLPPLLLGWAGAAAACSCCLLLPRHNISSDDSTGGNAGGAPSTAGR